MNLKPVNVSMVVRPKLEAMVRPISDVTIVLLQFHFQVGYLVASFVLINSEALKLPSDFLLVLRNHLFVLHSNSNRSASGSVPIRMSASISLPYSIANSKASCSSGLGDVTVEKLASGSSCSFTTVTFVKPNAFNPSRTGLLAVPCKGVKTILSLSLLLQQFHDLIG